MSECSHAVTFADPGRTRRQLLCRAGLTVLGLSLTPIVAACGAEAWTSASTGGTMIEMNDNNRFVPKNVTVRVGDTVTWRNVGSVGHTVTSDPSKAMKEGSVRLPPRVRPWDSGYIAGGKSWSRHAGRVYVLLHSPRGYGHDCLPHGDGVSPQRERPQGVLG